MNAPTNLLATISDRRATTIQLSWTAPSGAAVAGYQVRYAKVAITSTNFDDVSVTTAVTYAGTPAAPGQPDGIAVTGLYIENDYYFAVEATDGGGNRSAPTATSAPGTGQTCDCASGRCCAAHFNVSTITGTSGLTNEQFGIVFDGSGDVNGDGRSDVLVGASNGQHAYLFLGTAGNFAPSAPSVVFSGDTTTTRFGRGAAEIGDIDHDGLEDIAIASTSSSPPMIFIYKGRVTWPLTMGPANADYVITPDSTYTGSSLGISMARLGDFNGDGIDDFAVGASGFTVGAFGVGRVVVVLGSSSFANITLPDATHTITITGDSTLTSPLFGTAVVGLGNFYSVTTGTTLVVSAPGSAGMDSSAGRLYAFHGQAGSGGAIALSSADHTFPGPGANASLGTVLANLGPIVNTSPSLGAGNPNDAATTPGDTGSAYLFSGASATGPFAAHAILTRPNSGKPGQAIFGGGISGRSGTFSLLGDAKPDFGLVSQTFASFLILDGKKVAGLATGPTDASTVAASVVKLPAGWVNTGVGQGELFPDVNGDGHADFALGSAINAVPGSLAVFW